MITAIFYWTGVVAWGCSFGLCAWAGGCAVLDAWRERQALKAKHADVDALARATKALSAREARVWDNVPDDDEPHVANLGAC